VITPATTTSRYTGLAYDITQREQVLTRDVVHTREVYKDKKIKRENNTSRSNEDVDVSKDLLSLETTSRKPLSQKAFGNVITPATTTSRYTGISVQHYKTPKGVKLAINLQTPEGAEYGAIQQMTAELKRYDRLHEVRGRPDIDDEWFTDLLDQTIADIKATGNRAMCLGRPHAHGKRAAWFVNSFVIGVMDGTSIQQVILHLEDEFVTIDLTQPLSDQQARYYTSTGLYGHIKKGKSGAPRIADIPYTKFGE
jgi:Tfp pilus assembly protein PilZ